VESGVCAVDVGPLARANTAKHRMGATTGFNER
jgi:hypothetical protein